MEGLDYDLEDPFAVIPEVLPDYLMHDLWGGAAGAEMRDDWYEAYPHHWDESLNWCRVRWALHTQQFNELDMSRPADKIPGWIYRRALYAYKGMKYG